MTEQHSQRMPVLIDKIHDRAAFPALAESGSHGRKNQSSLKSL